MLMSHSFLPNTTEIYYVPHVSQYCNSLFETGVTFALQRPIGTANTDSHIDRVIGTTMEA